MANKQFKSDSPRLAFLVWVKFSVYGVQVEFRGRVAHTLIGRYALEDFNGFRVPKSLQEILC